LAWVVRNSIGSALFLLPASLAPSGSNSDSLWTIVGTGAEAVIGGAVPWLLGVPLSLSGALRKK